MTRRTPAKPTDPIPDAKAGVQLTVHTADVRLLSPELLDPNPWNPNRMDARTLAKVRAYLLREGWVKPMVVRPHPEAPGRFQILDGEHRWKIACALRQATVPCVVVEVDDHRARILTANLNELGGDAAPDALAQLVHDLARDASLADLETELPLSLRQLEDSLALLRVPHGLALELDAEAEAHEAGAPKVLTFVVDDVAPIEAALTALAGPLEGRNRRGRALTALAQAWIEANVVDAPDADGQPDTPPASEVVRTATEDAHAD